MAKLMATALALQRDAVRDHELARQDVVPGDDLAAHALGDHRLEGRRALVRPRRVGRVRGVQDAVDVSAALLQRPVGSAGPDGGADGVAEVLGIGAGCNLAEVGSSKGHLC
ncbi:hypothetical protein D3C71_1878910 [compost metagenome]